MGLRTDLGPRQSVGLQFPALWAQISLEMPNVLASLGLTHGYLQMHIHFASVQFIAAAEARGPSYKVS